MLSTLWWFDSSLEMFEIAIGDLVSFFVIYLSYVSSCLDSDNRSGTCSLEMSSPASPIDLRLLKPLELLFDRI